MITSGPAVMPTKPANTPLMVMEKSGFLNSAHEVNIAATAPAAAAKFVLRKMLATASASACAAKSEL